MIPSKKDSKSKTPQISIINEAQNGRKRQESKRIKILKILNFIL
jgi:hypothetical protein